jgi:hypothetical protein
MYDNNYYYILSRTRKLIIRKILFIAFLQHLCSEFTGSAEKTAQWDWQGLRTPRRAKLVFLERGGGSEIHRMLKFVMVS